jgi:hypothetical protein
MTTTEGITFIPSLDAVQPAVNAAKRLIDDYVNTLTRAELAVVNAAIPDGVKWAGLPNAQYIDGFDTEDGLPIGRTRRLSDAALDKAVKSLWNKGLIRLSGTDLATPDYRGKVWNGGPIYGDGVPGNSGIGLTDDNQSTSEWGVIYTTSAQAAGLIGAWLSGLHDTSPDWWVSPDAKDRVTVTVSAEIVDAIDLIREHYQWSNRVRALRESSQGLAQAVVAEREYPTNDEIAAAIIDTIDRGANLTPGDFWHALHATLHKFKDSARYGTEVKGAITPDEHEWRIRQHVKTIDELVDWIYDVTGGG